MRLTPRQITVLLLVSAVIFGAVPLLIVALSFYGDVP